jgi:hypothetical protein
VAVGGADDLAYLDAGAREEDAAGGSPMVAAAVGVDFGGAAELGEEDHHRAFQQTAGLQAAAAELGPAVILADAGRLIVNLESPSDFRGASGSGVFGETADI